MLHRSAIDEISDSEFKTIFGQLQGMNFLDRVSYVYKRGWGIYGKYSRVIGNKNYTIDLKNCSSIENENRWLDYLKEERAYAYENLSRDLEGMKENEPAQNMPYFLRGYRDYIHVHISSDDDMWEGYINAKSSKFPEIVEGKDYSTEFLMQAMGMAYYDIINEIDISLGSVAGDRIGIKHRVAILEILGIPDLIMTRFKDNLRSKGDGQKSDITNLLALISGIAPNKGGWGTFKAAVDDLLKAKETGTIYGSPKDANKKAGTSEEGNKYFISDSTLRKIVPILTTSLNIDNQGIIRLLKESSKKTTARKKL
jgi:hypothetical protein